jgi:hypothetical protein
MLRHTTLAPIEDDTEDSYWLIMGDRRSNAIFAFMDSLDLHAGTLSPRPYIAAMRPIRYHPNPGDDRIEQLAPSVLVAPVAVLPRREAYEVEVEGTPPAFVLEIVSPASLWRDMEVKPERYEVMGVREYALFDPLHRYLVPALQGHRRDQGKHGRFEPWTPDEQGRLWSDVLRVWLVAVGTELRLQRADGSLVPLPREERELWREAQAWRQEAPAWREAEEQREREAHGRWEAETEIARLGAELERLKGESDRRRGG